MFATHRQRLAASGVAVLAASVVTFLGGHADAGLTARITNTADRASSRVNLGTCTDAVTRDAALWAFKLNDTGSSAADFTAPSTPGSYQNSGLLPLSIVHQPGQGGCTRDAAGYVTVASAGNGTTGSAGWINGPATGLPAGSLGAGFTGEVWFRTTTTLGGNLLALGDKNFTTGLIGLPTFALSTKKDHQLFMYADGRLCFAMFKGSNLQISTTASYNDGAWHHAVGTVSPTAGSALYVDGALVGTQPSATSGEVNAIVSYLHLGYESLSGWTGAPARWAWNGDLAYGAIYTAPLTATQVLTHYRAGI